MFDRDNQSLEKKIFFLFKQHQSNVTFRTEISFRNNNKYKLIYIELFQLNFAVCFIRQQTFISRSTTKVVFVNKNLFMHSIQSQQFRFKTKSLNLFGSDHDKCELKLINRILWYLLMLTHTLFVQYN